MDWLSLLIFSPILGMLLLATVHRKNESLIKAIAVSATALSMVIAVLVFVLFHQGISHAVSYQWINFGHDNIVFLLNYELGVQGFSVLLLLLTSVLTLLAAFVATFQIKKNLKPFFLWLLIMEVGMLGVFSSENLVLFFLFFEMTLVPMFFLIGRWGDRERERTAYRFLIYNGLGSAVLLLAISALFARTGTTNIALLQEIMANEVQGSAAISETFRNGILWAMLIAFGIKMPIVPLHTWMVRVHVHAPPVLVIIHAGVLLKIGAYGIITFGAGIFPEQFAQISTFIAILGVINILYGALLALGQTELKHVLAYSSVSHMGIVLLGVAALNQPGYHGAIFQTLSHGVIAALLFLIVGIVHSRTQSTQLKDLTGLAKAMPIASGCWLVAGMATLGLPGTSGFISELLAFLGLFETEPILAGVGMVGLILTTVYVMRIILSMTHGKHTLKPPTELRDLTHSEMAPVFVLVLLIIAIGVWPSLLTSTLNLTVQTISIGIGG
ncbi:NuoM family protein [Thalassobacillus sp. CUG 92003]|uniref:complex I subunit 4 family protein n=1 Tax=Thalassobacillus sp. CUG 92003 TaxID=2736641 RepID=UPI0015E7ABE5|nr:NADH-quinone oxidoreductase subunit M [Thalassobacillus sp. CUG 92003]